MSKFLAPIHGWLFNKIVVLEGIEKKILEKYDSFEKNHQSLREQYGEFIPNQPLEEIIDKSNIHGWLQNQITIAESRQAAFIKVLLDDSEKHVEEIQAIYNKTGKEVAVDMNADTPTEILNVLNSVLLEGMPCDRVQVILEQDENSILWETKQCVHKKNWETNGVDVSYYYKFREAFTKGFVEVVSGDFKYTYENNDRQLNEIKRR